MIVPNIYKIAIIIVIFQNISFILIIIAEDEKKLIHPLFWTEFNIFEMIEERIIWTFIPIFI